MLGDLKTTHLLRASPRVQFYAQCCGAVVSVFMSVGIYVLFSAAYPCINDLALQDNCPFAVPDVGAWRAIALAVSSPSLPIPLSSGYTSIGLGLCAILLTIAKYRFVTPEKQHWVPNPNAVGIAFILNTTTYPAAMATGATIVFLWRKNYPESCAMCWCPALTCFFPFRIFCPLELFVLTANPLYRLLCHSRWIHRRGRFRGDCWSHTPSSGSKWND